MALSDLLNRAKARHEPILGATLHGIEARAVPIFVQIQDQRLSGISIEGLSATTARETAERVRSAIESLGLSFPRGRVEIKVAPSVARKSLYLDLPIALAVLVAMGKLVPKDGPYLALGQLTLNGTVTPDERGTIPVLHLARDLGATAIVPEYSAPLWAQPQAFARTVKSLGEAMEVVTERRAPERLPRTRKTPEPMRPFRGPKDLPSTLRPIFKEAAAGIRAGRPVILVGPEGSGLTMVAHALMTALPAPTVAIAEQMARIWSTAGLPILSAGLPFRAPHHTVTLAGLEGTRPGSVGDRPGELSIAHGGLLYLDEAQDFSGQTLEAVQMAFARKQTGWDLPADFALVLRVVVTGDEALDKRMLTRVTSRFPDAVVVRL